MNITRMSIIVAFFISAIILLNGIKESEIIITTQEKTYYSDLIQSVIDDTNFSMLRNSMYENGVLKIDVDECLETFNKSVALYNNIEENPHLIGDFMTHVPLILIIDGDGVYSYAIADVGQMEHVLHEKRYFTFYENTDDVVVKFSFYDYYEVYDLSNNLTYRGTFEEILSTGAANTLFSQGELALGNMRQKIITKHINEELLRINDHNNYADAAGVGYKFYIPDINTDFDNTIKGPGIITIFQGISAGNEALNIFDLSVATISDSINIEGYDNGGKLIYYESTDLNKIGAYVETFDNKKEAAKAGYYPAYY